MEKRTCQNCKKDFTIKSEDFSFYEKIKVPAPTWCPECRMIRRMNFRNERSLYKQNCALCKKSTISMYAPENKYIVYCNHCYNSDKWDPLDYGRDYNFSKTFFEQINDLFKAIPRRALFQDFAENSDYTNQSVYMKNCYLCFGGHHYEDSSYCAQNFFLNDCLDVDFSHKSELCFESIHLINCFRVRFGYYSNNCMDSWFIYGCRNCSNCIGCTNLMNKTYCIFNKQYSKEEYEKKVKEMNLSERENLEKMKKEFWQHSLDFPRKYANIKNIVNSTGNDLEQVLNCHYAFSVSDAENVKYTFFSPAGAKDCLDLDHSGLGTSETYELHSGFGDSRVSFSNRIYYSHNVSYSDDVYNSQNIFACAGLRKKSYYIFNKEYKKTEYDVLVEKIKKHMNEMPYEDKKGRIFKYGEFFPVEFMPFSYNDSVVCEYFPLTKEQAINKGYQWKDPETRNYQIDIKSENIPDHIKDVDDNIVNKVIECQHQGECNEQCTTAFKIIKPELEFYRKMNLPLPRLCPNCRHYQRVKQRNPLKLWHRQCQCAGEKSDNKVYQNTIQHFHSNEHCPNEFETTYSPDRKEIVYCEKCYQQEVY